MLKKAITGFGLGLRHQHMDAVLDEKPSLDWFEVISENVMSPGGFFVSGLEKIRKDYPIVFHGVSMSIGSTDPLNQEYLSALKQAILRFEPSWVSDHLCWTGVGSKNTHDLLPVALTEQTLTHISERILMVQEYLGQPLVIENPSSYVSFVDDEISEWDFLVELCNRSGCYLLLDVNNVYVSSFNHGFDAWQYISSLPKERIKQIHLAGHRQKETVIVDTHDESITDDVFALYEKTISHFGMIPTMIERDDNIPPLSDLLDELQVVREVASRALINKKVTA